MGARLARVIGIVAGLLALSACTKPIKVTTASQQAAYVAGFNQDRVARNATLVVRTYTGEKGDRQEFAGAQCDMASDEITASFVTPAKIIVPAFVQKKIYANRGRPTQLRVVCKAGGQTGIESIAAQGKRISMPTNYGLGVTLTITILSGAIASSSPWVYPSVMRVQMHGVRK